MVAEPSLVAIRQHKTRASGNPSPKVRSLFQEIEPAFSAIRLAAENLAKEPDGNEKTSEYVATINVHESDFLAGMDAIVRQCVAEAEQRVAWLRNLELAILALTLFVLLLEGLFIFRPAVNQISRTFERLQTFSGKLEAAKTQAEQANAAKTRFLGNISHELRTPLTAVLGMTDLARGASAADDRDRYLAIVHESGEHLLSLLNDLIDLSRIDQDEIQLLEEPFFPLEATEQIASMMRPACQAKGLELITNTQAGSQTVVVGDSRRIKQVLTNLVSNSIKWTDSGHIEISCTADSPTDSTGVLLVFRVTDTGPVIPSGDHERIFEPFTQLVDEENQGRGGVGLGLSICRRIVDAMGGSLRVANASAAGTTMELACSLPLASSKPRDNNTIHAVASAGVARVLLVEDTKVNQVLFESWIRSAGHEIFCADTGEAAVELCRQMPFDVALVDYQLPGINGSETARLIEEAASEANFTRPRLVCVTAHAGEETGKLNTEVFDSILTKPTPRDKLLHAIDSRDHRSGANHDPAVERDLADTLLEFVDPQYHALSKAITEQRYAAAAVVAHRFRGQLGYFGADELVHKFGALESACRVENADAVIEYLSVVEPALAELRSRLESDLGRRG